MSTTAMVILKTCSLHDVIRWIGLGDDTPVDGLPPGCALATRRLRAGEALVRDHQPLDHFYVVGAGSLKQSKVDAEGFEQVTGFALRGDVIGLDACSLGQYQANAVALEDTTLVMLARWAALREGGSDGTTVRLLQHAAAVELQRRTETQYLMAPANAEVRVARFLIHFGRRQGELGFSAQRFRLPMSRRDIGSFLGLAHETVSRSITLLQTAGCIGVRLREVEVLDPLGLARLAHATRGPSACGELKRLARDRLALVA